MVLEPLLNEVAAEDQERERERVIRLIAVSVGPSAGDDECSWNGHSFILSVFFAGENFVELDPAI